ncbi:Ski complex subunit Rec14 [Kickxella alabastrina]|uniref:Ski complex subunit Rec14 n=1 Tax=Kickxella alabastrina TaxID=61397 RepID=A0ACC1I932_9FUNG|nr:Ski complex subunit Rec14 [Kickxella alabastrina]
MASALYTPGAAVEQAHDDDIWHCSWIPGKHHLVTAGSDEVVKIWDAQTGDCIGTLKDNDYAITSLDINAQGTRILTSSMDNKMRIWNIDDALSRPGGDGGARKCKPALVVDSGPINAWKSRFVHQAGGGEARGSNSSAGLKEILASSTDSGTIKLWSGSDGREMRELSTSRRSFMYALAVSPDGTKAACAGVGSHIYVFDIESGALSCTFSGHSDNVRSVSFSADSTLLVTASDDKQVQLYDVRHGVAVTAFSGHHGWVLGAEIHPGGMYIASASLDTKVKVWDVGQRKCVETHGQHSSAAWSVAWQRSSDDVVAMKPMLASVGEDRSIHFYDPLLA